MGRQNVLTEPVEPPKKQCNGKSSLNGPYLAPPKSGRNGHANGTNVNGTNGFAVAAATAASPPVARKPLGKDEYEDTPWLMVVSTYFSCYLIILLGHLRDFFRIIGLERSYNYGIEKNREDYVPLFQGWESFYNRNVYRPIRDCWNRPVVSVPGAKLTFRDRTSSNYNWTFDYHDTFTEYINMGSYNYLGFAENSGPCADAVEKAVRENGCGVGSTRQELGTHAIHKELETLIARFLGVEDAIVFGMGFATNSTNIPALARKGTLIVSDELNHSSLILGCRTSGAKVRIFRHNDIPHLEEILRESVVSGQPRTGRPWKKIIIFVEGIYSMEGSIVNLPKVIELKKKYKAYLFMDEAHSIGALGPHGRGVVDYFGLDPRQVDILMGTFTKTFGAAGGYIAGDRRLINYIRSASHSCVYANSMPIFVAQQIIASCQEIMLETANGNPSKGRIDQLARNTQYFRKKLKQLGFIIYGNEDSPVVPLMLFVPGKIPGFFRYLFERGIATITVGYPATHLTLSRVRFCLSAAHTKEMLDYTISICDKAGDYLFLKHSKIPRSKEEVIY